MLLLSYTMSIEDDILEHTKKARNEIESVHGGVEVINGACHDNAIFLCDYFLEHTEYKPYIRWGAVNNKYEYESVKEAEKDGTVHFWVELETDEGWVYADLFTMKSVNEDIPVGDTFASKELPSSYQQLDETLFEYIPSQIQSNDLLGFVDYEHLKMKIPPES